MQVREPQIKRPVSSFFIRGSVVDTEYVHLKVQIRELLFSNLVFTTFKSHEGKHNSIDIIHSENSLYSYFYDFFVSIFFVNMFTKI